MKEQVNSLLLTLVVIAVLWFILSQLRIIVFVPMPWWILALLVAGGIVVLYLVLDHLINRTR